MSEQGKSKFKHWLIGLLTGSAISAPVTAYICKKVYDSKAETVTEKVSEEVPRCINVVATQENKPEEEAPDPNTYNTDIDEEESEAVHQQYLDKVEMYAKEGEISPHIISSDEFSNDHMMEKSFVNWYETDDVFEEDLYTIPDPFKTFGVHSGKELFKNADERPDPDICYLRNETSSTDYEISRIHGSYDQIVGGEENLGQTDT